MLKLVKNIIFFRTPFFSSTKTISLKIKDENNDFHSQYIENYKFHFIDIIHSTPKRETGKGTYSFV